MFFEKHIQVLSLIIFLKIIAVIINCYVTSFYGVYAFIIWANCIQLINYS